MNLEISDFTNPLFDNTTFVIIARGKSKWIEGSTVTDDFNRVNIAYRSDTGELRVTSQENSILYIGNIKTTEDYERKLKYVDKKLRKRR